MINKKLKVNRRLAYVFTALFAFISIGLTPAYALDERTIDVVSVTWKGAAALPTTVSDIATAIDTNVNTRWKIYTTLVGAPTDRTISFKSGKILTEPINVPSQMPCSGSAVSVFMGDVRVEAYKRLGISDSSKRYLVITTPAAGCAWSGRAPLGEAKSTSGTIVIHDTGTDAGFVIAHELGHTFGLGHTNFLSCTSGAKDGPWGDDCSAVEYGGVVDVMGNQDTNSTLNTYHQWRMGLLDDSQVKQVWQSETLTLSPSDYATGLKAIYLRDGNAAYWIEYRRSNPSVSYREGLVVFRLDPPPITNVVSPNPEDALANEFSDALGTDVWMLNMDNYRYSFSRGSGSMTTKNAATYSGQITISATTSPTGAAVTITRAPDVTPPPTPVLLNVNEWRYPSIEIMQPQEDADSIITGYEGSFDGVIKEIAGSAPDNWYPTVLNPFKPQKTLHVRDLPEGSYSFALRVIDLAGNKSGWSEPIKVVIDRGHPTVLPEFSLSAINANEVTLAWNGAKDSGSGLCQTNLVNQEGLVLQSSTEKTSPHFINNVGKALIATAQLFDCTGNGVTGELSLVDKISPANGFSKTGKWSSVASLYRTGSIKCTGKCTASFIAKGKFDVLVGSGSSIIKIGKKTLALVSPSNSAKIRIGASLDLGGTTKTVQISGSNFVLVGVHTSNANFTDKKELDRVPSPIDLSLNDDAQVLLAKYGLIQSDFSQEWSVLPMGGGTTIKDATLDLCSADYPSEKNRIERRQVVASKTGSPYSFLSSEVVRYSSESAAAEALKELLMAESTCKKEGGFKDSTGAKITYTFSEIKNIPKGVVPEDSRLFIRATIDFGNRISQLLGFYQYDGALYTGLYVMRDSDVAYTDAEVSTWMQVAVTMATRLKKQSLF